MAGRVLSDASLLIALARVDGLPWLGALFTTVWVPQEVEREVLSGRGMPDEAAIAKAFELGILQVCASTPDAPVLPDLDEGEAACIRIALPDAQPALLPIDEHAGRAVAM